MKSALKDFLSNLPAGPVQDQRTLEIRLANEWRMLRGSNAEGMHAGKLIGRAENPVWQPPYLTFSLERHGGAAMGSTRAELRHWTIDTTSCTASATRKGYRQKHAIADRVYTGPIAQKSMAISADFMKPI
jgi:hypothetical protein